MVKVEFRQYVFNGRKCLKFRKMINLPFYPMPGLELILGYTAKGAVTTTIGAKGFYHIATGILTVDCTDWYIGRPSDLDPTIEWPDKEATTVEFMVKHGWELSGLKSTRELGCTDSEPESKEVYNRCS